MYAPEAGDGVEKSILKEKKNQIQLENKIGSIPCTVFAHSSVLYHDSIPRILQDNEALLLNRLHAPEVRDGAEESMKKISI